MRLPQRSFVNKEDQRYKIMGTQESISGWCWKRHHRRGFWTSPHNIYFAEVMVKAAKKTVVSAARSVGIPSDLPRFNFVSQDITYQEKLRYIILHFYFLNFSNVIFYDCMFEAFRLRVFLRWIVFLRKVIVLILKRKIYYVPSRNIFMLSVELSSSLGI